MAPIRLAEGTASLSMLNRKPGFINVVPVTLPPGRARLATPAAPTPSPLMDMTIGSVVVRRLAEKRAGR
jgi:hypothetical protein